MMKAYLLETVLIVTAVGVLMAGLFIKKDKKRRLPALVAGAVLTLLAVGSWLFADGAITMTAIALTAGVVAYVFALDWMTYRKFSTGEYAFFYLIAMAGIVTIIGARDFFILFLGMETAQTAFLFLASYKRYGMRSTVAAMRVFSSSYLSSGLFLTGLGVLYTLTGTFDYTRTAAFFRTSAPSTPAVIGVSFVTVSLLMKTGFVSFQTKFIDIYEGMPSPVTVFAGVVWRLVPLTVFAILIRQPLAAFVFYWRPVLSAAAVLIAATGAVKSVRQTNVKRLTACVVMCGNAVALTALASGDMPAFWFLLIVQTVLFAGFFAIILSMRTPDMLSEDISSLKSKGKTNFLRGVFFSVIFAGLTALPPFAGFWGVFFVLKSAVAVGYFFVAAAVLSAMMLQSYACLKAVRLLYTDSPVSDDFLPVGTAMRRVIILAAVFAGGCIAMILPLWHAVKNAVM